jgi:hypothetical protein
LDLAAQVRTGGAVKSAQKQVVIVTLDMNTMMHIENTLDDGPLAAPAPDVADIIQTGKAVLNSDNYFCRSATTTFAGSSRPDGG